MAEYSAKTVTTSCFGGYGADTSPSAVSFCFLCIWNFIVSRMTRFFLFFFIFFSVLICSESPKLVLCSWQRCYVSNETLSRKLFLRGVSSRRYFVDDAFYVDVSVFNVYQVVSNNFVLPAQNNVYENWYLRVFKLIDCFEIRFQFENNAD